MAPASIPTSSSPNQPSSEHATKPETAQSQPTDPATANHLQWTVKGSSELTDPGNILGKTKSEEYVSNGVLIKHS